MEPQARRVESVWEESFHGGSGSGGVELVSEVPGFTGSRMGTTSSCHRVLLPDLKPATGWFTLDSHPLMFLSCLAVCPVFSFGLTDYFESFSNHI